MADVSDLNPAFSSLLNAYTGALDKAGIRYRLDSGYRSPEQQAEIYTRSNQGRSFAAAPAWRSFHNYGLAADVIPNNPADYARMHELARQAGLYDAQGGLGFTSYDPPHVEMPGSLSNLISQYHLANWRPESMPAPATGAIAYGGPSAQPSRPGTATPTQTTMFAGVNSDARGMRNNNPGNLVDNAWTQSLPGYKGSDGKFAIFDTPQHGALALDQNLAHYGTKGIDTPLAIASAWAPASDNNNPNSYGAQIAKSLGVGVNDKIDINNPAVRAKVAQTIGLVENGPGKSTGFAVALGAPTTSTTSAPPGTTINSTPVAAGLGGQMPQLAQNLKKTLGLPDDDAQGQGQQEIKPQQMPPPPGARNVSPLLGGPGGIGQGQVSPAYEQRMAALNQPMTWGSAPPGQMPGTGYGAQVQPSVYGTSLMSNLGRSLDPMWMNSWGT